MCDTAGLHAEYARMAVQPTNESRSEPVAGSEEASEPKDVVDIAVATDLTGWIPGGAPCISWCRRYITRQGG